MAVTPTAEQLSRYENGVAAVDSFGPSSTVRLVQTEGSIKKRASIQLLVMNKGQQPFNIGPENVRAELADGTPVAIINYDQLVREEKKRKMWAAIAAGLGAAGNSMSASNAGWSSGTATYNGSSYGTFGTTPYRSSSSGTVSYSGYDYGQAQAAQAIADRQNDETFDRMAANNSARAEALKVNMRTSTVDPDQIFGGSVMYELPPSVRGSKVEVPVTFIVTAGGDDHRFRAVLKRQ